MQFKEVIGQHETKQQLVELVTHNRLSHALLFLGKEGNGSLQLAIALAQYLTCEKINSKGKSQNSKSSLFEETPGHSPLTTGRSPNDSCGECPSCTKASQLIHPDIHFSYPVVTHKSAPPPH